MLVSLAKPAVFLLPILLLILGISSVWGQALTLSLSMNAHWSGPDYLGQSMTVWISVVNQASIAMQVQSLMVSFDWYNTVTGNTPRVLQAGENSTWEFDNIQIPSSTWTGQHSFVASVMVGWADSSGGWSHTLSSPMQQTTNFGVQQAPSAQSQEGYTTCGQGGCAVFNEQGYTTPIGPNIPTGGNGGFLDFWGPTITVVVLLVALIIGVGIVGSRRKKTPDPQNCGTKQP